MAQDTAGRLSKGHAEVESSVKTGKGNHCTCDATDQPNSECCQAVSGNQPSWRLLVCAYARVRRAIHNISKKAEKQTSKVLLLHEIREAEEEVVQPCQQEAFHNEYNTTKEPTYQAKPNDEDGSIRSNGRLQFAEYLPYDVGFPMILPRGHCYQTYCQALSHTGQPFSRH